MTTKQKIKVHLPELISVALLSEHQENSQKQSRHVFKELRESIREHGFDESLIVRPTEDGYEVVSGNHRFRAGKAEGMLEIPCVVRADWDDVEAQIQLVRRNYVRGSIDKQAFTTAVDVLASESSLDLQVIYERMGFEDADVFSDYYQKEKEREQQMAQRTAASPAVKMLDDLGSILSTLFAEHGDSIPNSFIVFPAGGKNHLYVASTPTLKLTLAKITTRCMEEGLDINVVLGGLLAIAMHQSAFLKSDTDNKSQFVADKAGDSDIEII